MSNSLTITNVSKKYYNKVALENINLTFEPGKIYGLLGPNGSGKTTLMKLIAGLHKQTNGDILVNGMPVSYKTKAIISYLPTENFLVENMKITKILKFYEDMYSDFRINYANDLLHKFKIDTNMCVKNLSSGLTAKLKVALTLSRDAYIYMLDEPLNGVDIISKDIIIETIVNSYSEDKIIIISSHMVSELEKLFDCVIFLQDSHVILNGDAEQLRIEHKNSIENIYKEVYSNVEFN